MNIILAYLSVTRDGVPVSTSQYPEPELGSLRVLFLARATVVVSESPLSIFIVNRWDTLIRLRCDKLNIDLFCQVVSEVPASVGVFVQETRNLLSAAPCLPVGWRGDGFPKAQPPGARFSQGFLQ